MYDPNGGGDEASGPAAQMKGPGRTLISCPTGASGPIDLIGFRDGSLGVRRNGRTVGVWEPHEREQGFRVYRMLTGMGAKGKWRRKGQGPDLVLFLRRGRAGDAGDN